MREEEWRILTVCDVTHRTRRGRRRHLDREWCARQRRNDLRIRRYRNEDLDVYRLFGVIVVDGRRVVVVVNGCRRMFGEVRVNLVPVMMWRVVIVEVRVHKQRAQRSNRHESRRTARDQLAKH